MRTIQELGTELRKYRVENNIDINLITKDMKSSKNNIYLLEEGKYKTSNVKARLMYKKYIERLGLNYDDYDEDIKKIFPNVVEKTINLSDEVLLDEVKFKKKKKINKGLVSVIIVFIFLICLIPLTVYNFNNKIVDNTVSNETTLLSETTLEPEVVIEPKIKELEVKRISDYQIEVYLDNLKDVDVKIEAGDTTYYDYSEAGISKEQGTLQKGDEKELKFKDASQVQINIGNLQKTKIYVNEYEITQKLKEKGYQNYITFKKEE